MKILNDLDSAGRERKRDEEERGARRKEGRGGRSDEEEGGTKRKQQQGGRSDDKGQKNEKVLKEMNKAHKANDASS